MRNVILIGMPGCGKSTVGVLSAKVLGLSFLDTDLLVQSRAGLLLQDIIDQKGLTGFLRLEEDALLSLSVTDTLIATGGSAVYSRCAMEHLSSVGTVVYLKSTLPLIKEHLSDFSRRGIAMPASMTIGDLYAERVPLYEKYADVTVDVSSGTLTDNMNRLVIALKNYRG